MKKEFFEDISLKIKELLSNSPTADLEKNINALLQGVFTKLALVSREEFDVQADVLRRTRAQLADCEAKMALLQNNLIALEKALQKSNTP